MSARWAVALVAVMLMGCGPVLPTPTPTPLGHATGERDLVLRMSVGGGLVYPGLTIEQPPDFTLYGDGRIIHRVTFTAADGTLTSELRLGQLSPSAVDDLLLMALSEGGLATAHDFYENDQIYDAATTHFEIRAGSVDRVVNVYALGFMDDLTPDARERAGFRALVERIDAATSAAADLGTYQPAAYRVSLLNPYDGQAATAPWPWPELVPADFQLLDNGFRTRIVTPAQGEAVLSLGFTSDLVARAPDGPLYLIRVRALLPDEIPTP